MNSYNFWLKLERLPPLLMRLLAKHPVERYRLMTDDEIVDEARSPYVTLDTVKRLNWLRSWEDVTVGTIRDFSQACGIDLANPTRMKNITRYLKSRPSWSHLRRDAQFAEYKERLNLLFK